jgi:SAM-dependent methyltransferase
VTAATDAWGAAAYERVAEEFAPIHERVLSAVGLRPGERLLDVGCGTGGLAVQAARLGADVVGLDLSPGQLEKARAAVAAEGLRIRLDEGDCQAMPYGDGSFDVVVSVFAAVFAPSHAAAAAELARVCRPGGRLALTAWPHDGWAVAGDLVGREYPDGDESTRWVRPEYVRTLLGGAFDLRFELGLWELRRASAEEVWELTAASVPPFKAWLDTLDSERRARVAAVYRGLFKDGLFRRSYLLVLGERT